MKTKEIGSFEAKTHLSELLESVRQGQVYLITRRGRRVAELRPVPADGERLRFGCDKGRVKVEADFDAPVPELAEYAK